MPENNTPATPEVDPRIEKTPGAGKKGMIIRYAVAVALATAIVVVVLAIRGVFSESLESKDLVRHFSDAFFVSGGLLICFAALAWSGRHGTFDGLGYWGSLFIQRWTNNKKNWKAKESYAEYKERVHNPDKRRPIAYLSIVGGVYFAVSIILLIVWYQAF